VVVRMLYRSVQPAIPLRLTMFLAAVSLEATMLATRITEIERWTLWEKRTDGRQDIS
jgi:hypothetical protein